MVKRDQDIAEITNDMALVMSDKYETDVTIKSVEQKIALLPQAHEKPSDVNNKAGIN